MSTIQNVRSAGDGEVINLPAAAHMTNELLMANFSSIDAKYQESDTCRDLDRSLRDYLSPSKIRIESCVCFGTGTVSGYFDDKNMLYMRPNHHEKAMHQLALFRGTIDLIGGWYAS